MTVKANPIRQLKRFALEGIPHDLHGQPATDKLWLNYEERDREPPPVLHQISAGKPLDN